MKSNPSNTQLNKGIISSYYQCIVCGAPLYSTDHGNGEVTYHCSSDEARFWQFERGSVEQKISMDHWDKSRKEIQLSSIY